MYVFRFLQKYIFNKKTTNNAYKIKLKKKKKFWYRKAKVIPQIVGKKIKIHTGKKFYLLDVKKDIINFKLGEFSFTRARYVYRRKKDKKLKLKIIKLEIKKKRIIERLSRKKTTNNKKK